MLCVPTVAGRDDAVELQVVCGQGVGDSLRRDHEEPLRDGLRGAGLRAEGHAREDVDVVDLTGGVLAAGDGARLQNTCILSELSLASQT